MQGGRAFRLQPGPDTAVQRTQQARILEHIEQLKPLLQQNSDVIAVLQHGFIGAWGEGYYTDVFHTNYQATTQNCMDRAEVMAALLDALPTERMIQVRMPQNKLWLAVYNGIPHTVRPSTGCYPSESLQAAERGAMRKELSDTPPRTTG